MDIKREAVDEEYKGEGHPPDEGWCDVSMEASDATKYFEDVSKTIKSESPILSCLQRTYVKEDIAENGNIGEMSFSESEEQIEILTAKTESFDGNNFSLSKTSDSLVPKDEIRIVKYSIKKEIYLDNELVPVIIVEKCSFFEHYFVCCACFCVFGTEISLNVHKDVHNSSKSQVKCLEKLFKCDECDFISKYGSYLKTHKRYHTGEKPYKCDMCAYECAQSNQLKTHKISHTGIKPFKCEICRFEFTKASHLKAHKIIHSGKKPFNCDLCDFKSAYSDVIKTHKRSHSGEKPYICDLCVYKSVQSSSLKRHKMIHNAPTNSTAVFKSRKLSNTIIDKPYKCESCDYKSLKSSHLKSHRIIHSGEKPFDCDVCEFKSAHASALRSHKKSHSGEKPFQCDLCDYKSTQSSSLKRHKMSHIILK